MKVSITNWAVMLELTGKTLEYNMAKGDLTGVDPAWAMGKYFFDEVAVCTKTQAFYGRFVEGVKRGFMNVVFDFNFDHREIATKVKVHMFTMPDSSGNKTVMLLVKRLDKPLVIDAVSYTQTPVEPAIGKSAAQAEPEIQNIVNAVITAMNQGVNLGVVKGESQQSATQPPQVSAVVQATPDTAAPASKSRHQDILKF